MGETRNAHTILVGEPKRKIDYSEDLVVDATLIS